MKTFILNGKELKAKDFDFNLMCDLEEMGLSMEDVSKKPMSFIRAYISFCLNGDKEKAGKEITAHISGGGTFDDIISVFQAKVEESDFFRNA